jgi:hypothetical protein
MMYKMMKMLLMKQRDLISVAGVTLLLQGGCSGCLKKQYWELFVVGMEDGYEQTLFQGRGKTMHRRRRNDQLIFHESEEKGIAL